MDGREEIIKVHLGLGALEHSAHAHHDPMRQAMLRSVVHMTGVYLKVEDVASAAFCQSPHLHSPLDRLHQHVLMDAQAAFELYHTFVHSES